LIRHNSITARSRELTSLIKKDDLDSITFFADIYDSEPYFKGTKTQGSDRIERPYLNWLAMTQPQTLREELPKAAVKQGLTSRMIFVSENGMEKKVLDGRKTKAELRLRSSMLKHLKRIHELAGPMKMTDAWFKKYSDWYDKYDPQVVSQLQEHYMARKPTHVRKVSMLCAISRSPDMQLTEPDFDRALFILDKTESAMGDIFSSKAAETNATFVALVAEVMAHIKIKKELTFNELFGIMFNVCKEADLTTVVGNLYKAKKVDLVGLVQGNVNGKFNIDKNKTIIKWLG